MSVKGKIVRFIGGAFLNQAQIVSAESVGGFRRLVLRSNGPRPRAGTKMQFLLPGDEMRTYSPIPAEGGFALLGYRHAGGPGARWISEVEVGSQVRFVGPQASLEVLAGPVILVGDETSVAVAAAFETERPGQVHAVIQAKEVAEVEPAVHALGLRQAVIRPAGDLDGIVEAVLAARTLSPSAKVALTGGSELIVAVRAALRDRGIRDLKTKTYWIPGRAGLD